jgi:hypothetical protein
MSLSSLQLDMVFYSSFDQVTVYLLKSVFVPVGKFPWVCSAQLLRKW